jgi:spore coat polysaccharide biosynthesis protein SpsF (cytidylyltransferase family)
MMKSAIINQVVEELKSIPNGLQHQVLKFVQSLKVVTKNGVPGRRLIRFAGDIPLEDLQIISDAIEAGCEQVDQNEW